MSLYGKLTFSHQVYDCVSLLTNGVFVAVFLLCVSVCVCVNLSCMLEFVSVVATWVCLPDSMLIRGSDYDKVYVR